MSESKHTIYERMFHSAVAALAEISDALGIPEDVASTANGNAEILHAIRALLKERHTLANDAAKYRWALNNSCWIRGEHAAYVAIPVAREADLSCVAMRDAAIDEAMLAEKGE